MSTIRHRIAGLILVLAVFPAHADELEDRMVAYRDCTEAAMPLLDDGKSDAETIATGLHAQCRDEFEAIYQARPGVSRQEWQQILKPHVVQSLLKYRVMRASQPVARPVKPTS